MVWAKVRKELPVRSEMLKRQPLSRTMPLDEVKEEGKGVAVNVNQVN